jgi:hypothetical protein
MKKILLNLDQIVDKCTNTEENFEAIFINLNIRLLRKLNHKLGCLNSKNTIPFSSDTREAIEKGDATRLGFIRGEFMCLGNLPIKSYKTNKNFKQLPFITVLDLSKPVKNISNLKCSN